MSRALGFTASLPALLMMRLFSSTICDGSGRGGRSSRASVTTSRSWSEEHSTDAEEVIDVDSSGELRTHSEMSLRSPGASLNCCSFQPSTSAKD